MNPELEKKIRKNTYGKTQAIKITFPPGFGEIALKEIESILKTPWVAQPFLGEIYLIKNEIFVKHIRMQAIIELLIRNQCLSDIRLILFKGKAIGKAAVEKQSLTVPWEFFLNKKMSLKIRVNSIASKAFHETALKDIISHIVNEYVSQIVSGEDQNETTCLYADLHKDKLTLSISLAGQPLYKRGYRGVLSASAPLREDIASACLKKSLEFAEQYTNLFIPENILIPFSGTGTFALEYIQSYFNFPSALFGREYALQKMSFFRKENFDFLLKTARENCTLNKDNPSIQLYCVDTSDNANQALLENIVRLEEAVAKNSFQLPAHLFSTHKDNFLKMDFSTLLVGKDKKCGNILLPLNPPYGIRLAKKADTIHFYKNIANKINELFKLAEKDKKNVLGFILCPNEETWSIFSKNLACSRMETYHFTQGGLDIRVCQFFY